MEKQNFLLEIGTEELPPSYIEPALEQLREWGRTWASARQIVAWGTPRRLLLYIRNLPRFKTATVWGPPLSRARGERGRWNRNAVGFARSQGKTAKALEVGRKNGKAYLKMQVRRDLGQELKNEIPFILQSLSFPKSMRWFPGSTFRFARPIRWLVCLWGEQILPVTIAGVKAGRFTYGHRFFGSGPWKLKSADLKGYQECLARNYVLVNPQERKRKLIRELLPKLRKYWPGMQASDLDEKLLVEVCYLVEYPRVILGEFEERFLNLPPPVLITAMESHQRYFPILDRNGRLLPRFLIVVNGPYRDHRIIRMNNERVLRARLADAEFFWKEDLSRSLEERCPDLKGVIFHEKLGNYFDKMERLIELAPFIARKLKYSSREVTRIKRAALLSKADLTTAMVTEFTELQGIMGREYALKSGEEREVASAIYEHYLPRSVEDGLPATRTGLALALADKLDTVVAFLSAGIKPSGSQDPYGLRRQAQGAIRLMVEKQLTFSFRLLAIQSLRLLDVEDLTPGKILSEVFSFFQGRLEAYLESRGVPPDISRAVLASGWDDFQDVKKRVETLMRLRGLDVLLAATTIVERTYNIFREEIFSGKEKVKENLLMEPAEKKLFEIYISKTSAFKALVEEKKYRLATELYARTFSRPLHRFFDEVMVNVKSKKLRMNRLILLHKINRLYTEKVADLSLLQFERGEYIL